MVYTTMLLRQPAGLSEQTCLYAEDADWLSSSVSPRAARGHSHSAQGHPGLLMIHWRRERQRWCWCSNWKAQQRCREEIPVVATASDWVCITGGKSPNFSFPHTAGADRASIWFLALWLPHPVIELTPFKLIDDTCLCFVSVAWN